METTTALSTTVATEFGNIQICNEHEAIAEASDIATQNGCPCGVWKRDAWFTVCDLAPEMIEPDPELSGWRLWAVVDPDGVEL